MTGCVSCYGCLFCINSPDPASNPDCKDVKKKNSSKKKAKSKGLLLA